MKVSLETIEGLAFQVKLGAALRKAREERKITRLELVKRLPSGIGDRTLLTYEHGNRALTVVRYVEICDRGLGIDGGALLSDVQAEWAKNRCGITIHVDLRLLLQDEDARFEAVRTWASGRLNVHPNAHVALTPEVVREMAVIFNCSHRDLAMYLYQFAPSDE